METISRVTAHHIVNVPIDPPPFRAVPNSTSAILVEIEATGGEVGWAMAEYAHELVVTFINRHLAPLLIGENPLRTARIASLVSKSFRERELGRLLVSALSTIDVALWDLKGKLLGQPVHHLLGGAREQVPVYVTHGAAYGADPVYERDELAAEAKYLVDLGIKHLKNVVGRQPIPDPEDDYLRMAAIREAVGPDIALSMDGNGLMSLPEAFRLCDLVEDLNIAFLEEPVYRNDPVLLRQLRQRTKIPIAAAQGVEVSARELLNAEAVDILQPNVNQDGGYTGALQVAELAAAYRVPLGHGNGAGPHNIAFQAGVRNGTIIEYHYHKWMAYNAIFRKVPQPENGILQVSNQPGLGLDPKEGIIAEFGAKG